MGLFRSICIYWHIKGLLLVAVTIFSLLGCSKESSVPVVKSQPSQETKEKTGEAQAKEKLKVALDSWTFGDTIEKFEKDHPEIILHDERLQILPFGLNAPVKLIRYEIGAGRSAKNITEKYESTYEFAVAMTVQNAKVGEAAKSITYKVGKFKDGKWAVLGDLP